jgi:hypothetical protein
MAQYHSKPTIAKRLLERMLAERRRDKTARRLERKQQQKSAHTVTNGVDPDIAHIIPGPQPLAVVDEAGDEAAPAAEIARSNR